MVFDNQKLDVVIISYDDYAKSGYEYYLALCSFGKHKYHYIRKEKNSTKILCLSKDKRKRKPETITKRADVLIVKGDNYFEIENNIFYMYDLRGKKRLPDFGNWQTKDNVKVIMIAGGSGFRRKSDIQTSCHYGFIPLEKYIKQIDFFCSISPDLNYPIMNGEWLPHAFNTDICENKFSYIKQDKKTPFKISYYHTNNHRKGENYLFEAVKILKEKKYNIQLFPINKVTLEESIRIKQSSYLYYVDMSIIGAYGKSGVEAMAYGIPTIASIRKQSIEQSMPYKEQYKDAPIIKCNSTKNLVETIKAIIDGKINIFDYSKKGFEYAKEIHSYQTISKHIDNLIEKVTKQNKINNVTIVVLSCGEVTTTTAIKTAKEITDNVYIIDNLTHSLAIHKAFEIGIKSKDDFMFIVGGDYFLFSEKIKEIMKTMTPDNKIFRIRLSHKDKFFKQRRGWSIYNTKILKKHLGLYEFEKIQPEGNFCSQLQKLGYKEIVFTKEQYGTHDYNQSDFDLYRKGYLWYHKLSEAMKKVYVEYWKEQSIVDRDFKVVLLGYTDASKERKKTVRCDISQYNKNQIENKIKKELNETSNKRI